jgi:hypothetical protein
METPGCTKNMEGVAATGAIPRDTAWEDTGGSFFLDAECTRPDPLADDPAPAIDLGQSVVGLLGCAHAGVINTINHVQKLTDGQPIHRNFRPHLISVIAKLRAPSRRDPLPLRHSDRGARLSSWMRWQAQRDTAVAPESNALPERRHSRRTPRRFAHFYRFSSNHPSLTRHSRNQEQKFKHRPLPESHLAPMNKERNRCARKNVAQNAQDFSSKGLMPASMYCQPCVKTG